jgi:hypothetical protein
MTQTTSIDALAGVVEILTPLSSDERTRVVRAAMVLLGESHINDDASINQPAADVSDLQPRARAWLKQNSITIEQLQQIFHLSDGAAEVIAPHLPGRNRKEQTYNAYVLVGIGQLLLSGNTFFDDKSARLMCEKFGCYDSANHSAYLRDRGNEFTGTKERGWTLTAPGLKRGADIIKDMSKLNA